MAAAPSTAGATPAVRPLDGINIHDFLQGKSGFPDRYFYYFNYENLDGIRDNTWKLLVTWEASDWTSRDLRTGREPVVVQLYNLRNDPFEHFNLAEQNPEIVNQLKAEMKRFAGEVGAKLNF